MSVTRADRAAWQSARTLADLGELTARWIEGDLASQPGYCGPTDIEDPAMVPVLARLNRAGFVTNGSQQGLAEDGWEQRAAVEGFAGGHLSSRLIAALDGRAGVDVIAHAPWEMPRWRYRYDRAVVVTRRGDRDYTRFGARLPRRHIRDSWIGYGICSREAVAALCGAWQVTVIDPQWGRPDLLWNVLAAIVREEGATPGAGGRP